MMDLELEKQLVERAKHDKESFAELYDYYYPQIFGYVQRRTASIGIAQDITAETFFKVMKGIGKFQWRGIPFSSWLFRIANHEIINSVRKRKLRFLNLEQVAGSYHTDNIPDETSLEDELIRTEEDLQRHTEYLTMHRNIAKLSMKYQEVITLRFFENKQMKEISEILGKNEGTVKSLLHRGLRQLRTLME